jgi:hypothetical protein
MDELSPEQIKLMIQMLQKMLPEVSKKTKTSSSQHVEEDEEEEYKARPPRKQNSSSKKKTNNRHNKFEEMMEMNMHKEDILIDKKLRIHPTVPRARRFKTVKATCRVCGKSEEINPGLVPESIDRYKCNKCSTSAG